MSRKQTRVYNSKEYRVNRRLALERANYRCQWPGCSNPASTADHVVPLELGGTSSLDNLRASCRPCNSRGGATLSSEARRRRRIGTRSRIW